MMPPDAFSAYEEAYGSFGRALGPEITSLTPEEFNSTTGDNSSAVLVTDGLTIPLATPIENLEWYNKAYFQALGQKAGLTDVPIVYYDHLPRVLQNNPQAYVQSLQPLLDSLAQQGGILAMDHLDIETDRVVSELTALLDQFQLTATDILAAYDPLARHYNFAQPVTQKDPSRVHSQPHTYRDASRVAQVGTNIAIEESLSPGEIQQIWDFYTLRFSELSSQDPIKASSPFEEFEGLLTDEHMLKMVQRAGREVVSLCMFADIRDIPWANQDFYRTNFPIEYEEGHILFSPGVVSKPKLEGSGLPVMAALGRMISVSGVEQTILSFVCDKLSRKPVSTISHWALNRSGVVVDLKGTTSERIFHAFALQPTGQH